MLLQAKEGGNYQKPTWLGKGMVTVKPNRKLFMGTVLSGQYPCWSDPARKGYVQPVKNSYTWHRGPAVVYPINRLDQTPVERLATTIDFLH